MTGVRRRWPVIQEHFNNRPVESVIRTKRNGVLIAQAARLWVADDDLVMDVTYGRGLFWTVFRPAKLICHDKYKLDGVDFRELPEPDCSADVVVFDPPYMAPGGRVTSTIGEMNDRYGLVDVPKNPQETRELHEGGIKECARVLVPGGRLFVKTMDYISGGRLQKGRHHAVATAEACGLEQVDEFIHHGGLGPQPKTNPIRTCPCVADEVPATECDRCQGTGELGGEIRRQVHSRRSHSFLLVFQAPLRDMTPCSGRLYRLGEEERACELTRHGSGVRHRNSDLLWDDDVAMVML